MKNRHKVAIGVLAGSILLKFPIVLTGLFVAVDLVEGLVFSWIGASKGFNAESIALAFLFGYISFYIVNNYEKLVRKLKRGAKRAGWKA